MPPSRRARAPWIVVLLAVLGGGGFVAWKSLRAPTDGRSGDGRRTSSDAADDAALGGRSSRSLVDVGPYGPPSRMTRAELDPMLASRLGVRRVAALRALAERGLEGTLPDGALDAGLRSEDPAERIWARAAALRIRGDRAFALELAEEAAAAPAFKEPAIALRAVDPDAGEALLRAVAERRARADGRALEGLDAVVARLAADPKDGAVAVAGALEAAAPEELAAWARIAAGVRPMPRGAVAALVGRWERATPAERSTIERALVAGDGDLSAAGPELSAFLVDRLDGAAPTDAFRWSGLVRRLPTLDGPLLARLAAIGHTDPVAAQNVLAAVAPMGDRARGAAETLVGLARTMAEGAQPVVAQALGGIDAPAVLAYAAQRLALGAPDEVDAWLGSLGPAHDPRPVVGPLAQRLSGPDEALAARAAATLARVCENAFPDEASAAFSAALDDGRPSVRAAAVAALDAVEAIDVATAERVAKAVDDADPAVRAAALRTASGLWRLGAEGAPLVPVLLRLAAPASGDGGAAEGAAEVRARAARSLASIAPDEPSVRAALLGFARDLSADVRRAGAWGLSRLPSPTPDEKAALGALKDDPQLGPLVAATLARPGWASVK